MDLLKLFQPKTMAVIGVSLTNESHPANVIFNKNNLRQRVRVFAVNNRGGELRGEKVYESISHVPGQVDLAVIATKAHLVPDVLSECVQAGAGAGIIISGGFAETGRKDLQDRVRAIATEGGFPFVGPNCLGIYSPPYLDTFFIPSERIVRPEQGKVALVSQSGGVLVDHMVKCAAEGVGVSAAVSIGNKAMVREIDLIRYFSEDPGTAVITFYVEGFDENEGRQFVMAAGECTKPIIIMKAGKTSEGTKAVKSHTASMAGDYAVFSSVMSQYGIVEATDEFELISFAEALSCYPGSIEGRVVVVTGSGGHGALCVDACAAHGLTVPGLDETAQGELRDQVSPVIQDIASFRNPIDLTGSSVDDDFAAVLRYLSRRQDIDCIITLLLPYLPGISTDLGARIGMIYQQEKKPIIAYVPHVEKYWMLIEGFMLNDVPVAHSVEDAVHMAEALKRHRSW
ncbi:MAG: CoA-binding protein [Syntrophorhabdaceae bacterium]|nr:CoA-binding protein [Syntrophorhabdaceae bacterium]